MDQQARDHVLIRLLLVGFWAFHAIPALAAGTRWGIWDWDHHFAFAEAERLAILDHGVIPLWNPYLSGGTFLLQHPQSSFLAPDFILILLFGAAIGMKLLIALRLGLGVWGAYVLGRRIGMVPAGAALCSIAFNGSSAYVAHLAFGHFEWTLAGYLPWVVLALLEWVRSRSLGWGAAAAVGIALLYLGGGMYLLFGLAFFGASFFFVEALRARSFRILAVSLAPFLVAGLLSSAKLLPSGELFSEHPRRFEPNRTLFEDHPARGALEIPKALAHIYVGPVFDYDVPPDLLRHKPFHNYSEDELRIRGQLFEDINFNAYAGLLPLLLLPFAFAWGGARSASSWGIGLGVLLCLALSDSLQRGLGFSPWQMLRELPVFGSLRTSGRFLIVASLPLAVLAGLGLSQITRRWSRIGRVPTPGLALVVVGLAIADLLIRNTPLVTKMFPFVPIEATPRAFVTESTSPQGFDYLAVLEGVGSYSAHSNLAYSGGAQSEEFWHVGEAFLQVGRGEAELLEIRPNRIVARVEAVDADTLVINQNWARGWHRLDREAEVLDEEGRIGTPVERADERVVLEYRPRTLVAGFALSALTSVALAIAFFLAARARSTQPAADRESIGSGRL